MLFNKVHSIFFILSIYHRDLILFLKKFNILSRVIICNFLHLESFHFFDFNSHRCEKDRNLVETKCQKGDK